VPEAPEELSPERSPPEGKAPPPGEVSTWPALPEGIALPWSFGDAEGEGEAALPPADPVPCANAADDTDATKTNDSERRVVFNVIANSLNEKLSIIDAAAWMDRAQACSVGASANGGTDH
jgi:hypothetical protein